MATLHLLNQMQHSNNLRQSSKTQRLTRSLSKTNKSRLSCEKQQAKARFEALTNCTKEQQKLIVRELLTTRTKQWKYDHYRVNSTFQNYGQTHIEPFPDNNTKYNTQFLRRSLHGNKLYMPAKDCGFFCPPQDQLYSQHYRPIVKSKREHNEDYELRTSLFEDTWVDKKRHRIMNNYKLEINPFRTQYSNSLISRMRKALPLHQPL